LGGNYLIAALVEQHGTVTVAFVTRYKKGPNSRRHSLPFRERNASDSGQRLVVVREGAFVLVIPPEQPVVDALLGDRKVRGVALKIVDVKREPLHGLHRDRRVCNA
jgi:hypothetical protein